MYDYTGRIVCSTAGHDKGSLFCVVGVQDFYLLLADGKRRKLAAPKRKKRGHVDMLDGEAFAHPVIQSLQGGEPVSDKALRRALAAFRENV